MINLEKYDNKNQIICEPKEIELKIEYGFKQHLIIVDRITQDSFYMDVKNEICNPHLKQVSLTFGSTIINNELLDVVNDRNHIIKDIRIEFDVFNLDNYEHDNKTLNIKQTIMYIDDIELNNPGMTICLDGHMVI